MIDGTRLYWWSPVREVRSLALEVRVASPGWLRAARVGGAPFRNFGDELSRNVVQYATGKRPRWAPASRADLFAVGSIIEKAVAGGAECDVWGSGVRGHADVSGDRSQTRFLAVRGTFTRDVLGLPLSTPLGDPALLLRSMRGRAEGGDRIVLIPHYHAFNSRSGHKQILMARRAGWRVVSPTQSLDSILLEIQSAALVLSSSLHGKIVADAIGIPAAFVDFGSRTEIDFKYRDYLSIWSQSLHFYGVRDLLSGVPAPVLKQANLARDDIDGKIDRVCGGLLEAAGRIKS